MMDLTSNLNLNLSQELELMLAPRLIAMLKTLQLPYNTLLAQIREYAEENVMLEIEKEDRLIEYLRFMASDKKIKKEADFRDLPGLKNIRDQVESLDEHLKQQLNLLEIEEPCRSICERLIENIDDQGYLLGYETIKAELKAVFKVEDAIIDQALEIVQELEPEGVGARNLKECLLIQIKAHHFENPELEKILTRVVSEHLEELGEENPERLAKEMRLSKEAVLQIKSFLKNNLNPYPGSLFGGETEHLVPSFVAEWDHGELKLTNLEKQYGPVLAISDRYLKMLESPKTDRETIAFLREKLASARDFLEQMQKRFETMQKIMEILTKEQREFLEKGQKWLKPFQQKSIAEALGLHPSTISRALADKYLQTPHGIFPLKLLCPRGKGTASIHHMKAVVKEIIEREAQEAPLSDTQIQSELKKEGILLKRRTVSSYRKKLHLPGSKARRGK